MSSLAPSTAPETAPAALPGAVVIAAIRRVLLWSLIVAFLYPAFMSGSKGICPGGVDANGGFVDSAGQSVDEAPQCIQLTLAPSPLVYVAIAVILLLALGRVMKAVDERGAAGPGVDPARSRAVRGDRDRHLARLVRADPDRAVHRRLLDRIQPVPLRLDRRRGDADDDLVTA